MLEVYWCDKLFIWFFCYSPLALASGSWPLVPWLLAQGMQQKVPAILCSHLPNDFPVKP